MEKINYKVTLLAPVLITRDGADDNVTETASYLPGSALIGIFAANYLKKKPMQNAHEDAVFYDWFLGGALSISPAFPFEQDGIGEIIFYPLPSCLRQEKDGNKIYNLLYEQRNNVSELGGFGQLTGQTVIRRELDTKLQFHHARDVSTGSSKKGIFFTYEALLPGQVFCGEIMGEPEKLEEFRKFFGASFEARLGKSKNAEYGKVLIELNEPGDEETGITGGDYFKTMHDLILTFISPGLFLNESGFSAVSKPVVIKYLADYLELETTDFDVTDIYLKQVMVENYLSVWKMKQPAEWALAPGSTVKLEFKTDITKAVKEKILTLARIGLGERKSEGFGRVRINWPIQNEYFLKKRAGLQVEIPDVPLPESAHKIYKGVLREYLLKKLESLALQDIVNYKKHPHNSLLGRLNLTLDSCNTALDFINEINNWKSCALEQLKGCQNSQGNLFDEMCDRKKLQDRLMGQVRVLTAKLEKATGLKFVELTIDSEDFNQLYKKYWRIVWDEIRKQNKLQKTAGGENECR